MRRKYKIGLFALVGISLLVVFFALYGVEAITDSPTPGKIFLALVALLFLVLASFGIAGFILSQSPPP